MAKRKAFTLVELVVVILILGILAGVAAPRLFSQAGEASETGLRQTLATIRNAIELYAAENNGQLPTCTGDGTGANNFHEQLRPYLVGLRFPSSPVGAQSNLVTPFSTSTATTDPGLPTSANANAGTSWIYSNFDGTFISASGEVGPSGVAYDQF